ncbi:MAG: hypothetical protein ACO3QA_10705, partial [Phycisphaerales bacterium]
MARTPNARGGVEPDPDLAHPAEDRRGPQRQRLTEGVLANTTISVRLAANHRADNQVADFDSLLGLESTLIKTVEGIARTDL